MKYQVVLSVVLLIAAVQCAPFELILLNQTGGEACLDGSAPGYYFQPGVGNDTDKYIIYFMGGGFCTGTSEKQVIQDCISRASTILGSSKEWATSFDSFVGILGSDPATNYFANWNHIIIMYCDGTFHQGYRKLPIQYGLKNENNLYFRGSINTQSIFNQLLQLKGMNQASEVVLSGGSAGGVAASIWADSLKGLLGSNVKYWAIPDSGYGINSLNVKTKSLLIQEQWKYLWKVANVDIAMPNSACLKAYPGFNYYCFFGQYNTKFIESPLFISQSEYDAWLIPNILGVDCINKQASLNDCSLEELTQIQTFRKLFIDSLRTSVSQKPGRGAWSVACVMHVLTGTTYDLLLYEVPMSSGNTLNAAITNWIQGKSPATSIDSVSWPNNKNCAWLPIPSESHFPEFPQFIKHSSQET